MKNITRPSKFFQILWFTCLSFFLTTNLKAQADSKEKSLSLFFGYHANKIQDLVFSPLIYRGSSVNALGLAYEKRTNKNLFQVEFAYDRVELEPNTLISSPAFGTRAASENQELRLQLAYAQPISSGEKLTLYAGALLKAKYYETELILGLGSEESYYYENSLNPWLVLDYQLVQKNKLRLQFHLPLLAFIARPEYAIVDNENIQGAEGLAYIYEKGDLSFWGDFQAVDFLFEFKRSFSSKIDGFTRYQLNYFRAKNPEQISALENNFDLGISFKF